jgi:glycosyltransferase involved in cell wall biosynthesis
MPRLLLVTETFPPDASVGAKRTRRIAHHLAHLGWDVDVLTVTTSGYERLDATLMDPSARYRVLRTSAVTPMLWGRRLRNRLRKSGAPPAGDAHGPPVGPEATQVRAEGLWAAGRALLTTPDEYLGWIPAAATAGLMRVARPDVIVASGPPFSSHLAASWIAGVRRVPLVLDYRDPWSSRRRRTGYAWLDRLERRWECGVLGRAAGVFATTQGICDAVRALRPLPARVIPNAYDLDLMRDIEPLEYARFTLVYTGSFYPGRDPGPILSALGHLKERRMMPERGLELRVVGGTPADVRRVLAGTGLDEHVVLEDLLPYREALRRIAGADVLLLVVGRSHAEMLPAKVFDYLATGRFILGIGPVPSEAADLLSSTGAGVMLDPDDVQGIAAALAARFSQPRPLRGDADLEGPYEAGRTMRDLDRFLREVLGEPAARRAAGG